MLAALLLGLALPAASQTPAPLFLLGRPELLSLRAQDRALLQRLPPGSPLRARADAELSAIEALLHPVRPAAPGTSKTSPSAQLQAALDPKMTAGRLFDRSGFGLLPAENNGSLGPAMRADDANVLADGRTAVMVGADAANYLNNNGFDDHLYQKFERQTFSLEVRRGLKTSALPALELGARVDLRRRRPGMLNGFIGGFESGLSALVHDDTFENGDRVGPDALTGTGEEISVGGTMVRASDGLSPLKLGDVLFTLKAALTRGDLASYVPQAAARLAVDLSPPGALDANGSFIGAGLSVSQRVTRRLTAHADARVMKTLGGSDGAGVPLRPWAYGGSAGFEWRFLKNTSFGLQGDFDTSPCGPAGLDSEAPRSDFTFGFTQLARLGAQRFTVQLYGREDLRVDGGEASLAPYSPPDLQAGVRLAWFPAPRR